MKSVTIKDVAAETGVSISTVNKALYGRPGVSEEKRLMIAETAEKMGYRPSRAAMSLARTRIKIGVVLPSAWPAYHEPIKAGILRALESLHDFFISGEVCYFETSDNAGQHVQEAFAKLKAHGCKAFIFTPGERDSYLQALQWADTEGLPVTLAGDARRGVPCLCSVETDVAACARLAADVLTATTSPESELCIVIGWSEFEPHKCKAQFFSQTCGRRVVEIDAHDNDEVMYERLSQMIEMHPYMEGVYIATSTCEGAVRAIEHAGRKLRLVTTDLSEHTRKYMENGIIDAVIYQNTCLQGALAVFSLIDYLTMRMIPPAVRLVAPRLYFKSSCPENPVDVLNELVIRG